jgi:arsenite methyltransferase
MRTNDNIKDMVRQKYGEIAQQSTTDNAASCCGAGGCNTEVVNIMTDDYDGLKGYAKEADLGLGCGLPTNSAGIKPGDTVLDLGSGAGNDCFVARAETGPDGRVIGVDFTPAMIEKARANAAQLGYQNVEFRQGDIEALPLTSGMVDVIVSNCVLNLVPNKAKAFAEMHRVLKADGHFSISDIVLTKELPHTLKEAAEMYAGCVAGAMREDAYLRLLTEAGFSNVTIVKRKPILIPSDILARYMSTDEVTHAQTEGLGIASITVRGSKDTKAAVCCTPNAQGTAKVTVATGETCGCGVNSTCC